jgi:hypothetical protein
MNTKLSWMRMSLFAIVGVMTTMIMNGCASSETARLAARTKIEPFYTVTINFDNDGCPISVTPPPQPSCALPADGLCAKPGKAVQWVSRPASALTTSPVVIRNDTMPGDYKYSVLGVTCTGADPVLDPPIRVER